MNFRSVPIHTDAAWGQEGIGHVSWSRNVTVIRSNEVTGLGFSIRSTFSALLAFLLAINVATASAAEKVFGLAEVLSHALENNGEIKALRAERGLREAAKIRAGLLPNPSLEFEGAGDFLFANEGERSFSAAYSQEMLTAGKRTKRLKVAGKDLEEYGHRIADAERLLAEEVKIAFYDLLLVEDRLKLAGRFVEINEQLLRIARDRLEAGGIPGVGGKPARGGGGGAPPGGGRGDAQCNGLTLRAAGGFFAGRRGYHGERSRQAHGTQAVRAPPSVRPAPGGEDGSGNEKGKRRQPFPLRQEEHRAERGSGFLQADGHGEVVVDLRQGYLSPTGRKSPADPGSLPPGAGGLPLRPRRAKEGPRRERRKPVGAPRMEHHQGETVGGGGRGGSMTGSPRIECDGGTRRK